MLLLVLALPAIAAVACLALSRTVASRWLGLGAAAALSVAGLALIAGRVGGLPVTLADRDWLALADRPVRLLLRFDGATWPLALIALLGGALALAVLALTLPRDLRGFGGLLAALVLTPLAVSVGLASADPLLLPLPWMVAAISAFVALRASGALVGSDAPLIALLAGVGGVLVAFAGAISLATSEPGAAPTAVTLTAALLLGILALGAPPLHASVGAATDAPAALSAVILGLGLPLLGGYALLDFGAAIGPVAPESWRAGLVAFGALTLLASSAGAAGTTRMRRIAGWQLSAQGGALIMAIGLGGQALTAAAPTLLANAAATTLATFLAIAALERRTGTDDLSALGSRGPFPIPGLAMLVAAASAAGFPGTLGFWGRLWTADALLSAAPWGIALLLAGSALLALTYVAPVAAFWRRDPSAVVPPTDTRVTDLLAALAVLPLLIAGAAPGMLWGVWLAETQQVLTPDARTAAPLLPEGIAQAAVALAALALVALPPLARRGSTRPLQADPETRAEGIMPPAALGHSLRGLAWVGSPDVAFARLWDAVRWLSAAVGRILALFERRYYLAGLLIAMIIVILVFI
ncbi:MAG: hypothetical protein RLZZ387_2476 [Chloroflexota bacterium]|jgi:formate hydrogenlyase subunit 3/multisubunit Na+/H+ antiporter MnhD subunit